MLKKAGLLFAIVTSLGLGGCYCGPSYGYGSYRARPVAYHYAPVYRARWHRW
jgi:hypothetical protein